MRPVLSRAMVRWFMRVTMLPPSSWRFHSVLTVAAKGAPGRGGTKMLMTVVCTPPLGACRAWSEDCAMRDGTQRPRIPTNKRKDAHFMAKLLRGAQGCRYASTAFIDLAIRVTVWEERRDSGEAGVKGPAF